MPDENQKRFMQEAIDLSIENVSRGNGGPFGAVVVKDGQIIARGCNQVTTKNDPTAHAEIIAIKEACKKLDSFQLDNCILYTSCEPCPMCLGAIYWARPKKVFYACNRTDAAEIDFDDQFIYDEIQKSTKNRQIEFKNIMKQEGFNVFKNWKLKPNKIKY